MQLFVDFNLKFIFIPASSTIVETLKRIVYQLSVVEGASSETADIARQTRFPPEAGYHVVLSVVHPRPDVLKVDLDAGNAIEGINFAQFYINLAASIT